MSLDPCTCSFVVITILFIQSYIQLRNMDSFKTGHQGYTSTPSVRDGPMFSYPCMTPVNSGTHELNELIDFSSPCDRKPSLLSGEKGNSFSCNNTLLDTDFDRFSQPVGSQGLSGPIYSSQIMNLLSFASQLKSLLSLADDQSRSCHKEYQPPVFDGTGSWEAFIDQFDRLANFSRWTDSERAERLAIGLTGDAARYVKRLTSSQLSDYYELRRMLSQRFGEPVNVNAILNQFNGRYRKENESVRQYARALQTFLERAFPHDSNPAMTYMLTQQFIKGVGDRDCSEYLSLNVSLSGENVWQNLIEKAELYEAVKGLQVGKPKSVNVESQNNTPRISSQVVTPAPVANQYSKNREQQAKDATQKQVRFSETNDQSVKQRPLENMICYRCGGQGHFARNCVVNMSEN